MSTPPTHYAVLGVRQDVTPEELKRRYHELVRRYHPDIAHGAAITSIVRINQAYQTLRDPERRRTYDVALSGGTPPEQAAAPSLSVLAAWLSEAEAAYMQGKANDAHRLCQKILKADGRNIKALTLFSDTLIQLNQADRAVAVLRIALRIAPNPMLQSKLSRLQAAAASNVQKRPE